MASQYAFSPMGLSQVATVGGAAPVTLSLSVTSVGKTSPIALTNGNYIPSTIRIMNRGTESLFVQFAESAAAISVSPTIGMQILSNTVEKFNLNGRAFIALGCAGTFTVTAGITLGQGM